jgi:hypothetical protein
LAQIAAKIKFGSNAIGRFASSPDTKDVNDDKDDKELDPDFSNIPVNRPPSPVKKFIGDTVQVFIELFKNVQALARRAFASDDEQSARDTLERMFQTCNFYNSGSLMWIPDTKDRFWIQTVVNKKFLEDAPLNAGPSLGPGPVRFLQELLVCFPGY